MTTDTSAAADGGADGAPVGGDVRGLRDLGLQGSYSFGDQTLTGFYIPALRAAYRYDRMAGYYSSTSLRAAGPGVLAFLRNAKVHGGGMRLIVGTQLSEQDVAAVRAGARSLDGALRDSAGRVDFDLDAGLPGDDYLLLLSWMVREGLLQIKVGVPLDVQGRPLEPAETDAYFHSKTGILTDPAGDRVAWTGSSNETVNGWLKNHETLTVTKSWLSAAVWEEQGRPLVEKFQAHWDDTAGAGWTIRDLADLDDRFLTLAPPDYDPPATDPIWDLLGIPDPDAQRVVAVDPDAARAELARIAGLPAARPYTAALTAPAEPLPHQTSILATAVAQYPRGFLFADPVGFGKTLELGFTIRELLLSGRAETALLLVPASVMVQWQEELAEKLGLYVPRYTGGEFLDHRGQPVPTPAGANPWSAHPVVLASSHLARRRSRRAQVVAAGPWDIVAVDEAHHARRRGSKPTDTPNALLALLQQMRAEGSWKALYLATATPMQMHPHEAWDLLALLDLPGSWGGSAEQFLAYYEQLRLPSGQRDWAFLQRMAADHFNAEHAYRDTRLEQAIQAELGKVKSRPVTRFHSRGITAEKAQHLSPAEDRLLERWLRAHTPVTDRAFRNTRDTLRRYQAMGIIDPGTNIPDRHVDDVFIDLDPAWERPLYDRIEAYISRYYNAYMSRGSKALGFIMTVYRRRLTSSFHAIRRSLERRLESLQSGGDLALMLTGDDVAATEDDPVFDAEDLGTALALLDAEIEELADFVRDLADLPGQDTKATRLVDDLRRVFRTDRTAVVFTQYTDTMDYLRGRLLAAGYESIGCYSGRGGELYDPATGGWAPLTKTELKTRFRDGRVQILLGTDAMSEGLNLQTSSHLFNYDMPWNLMRVEQRIGRIDRIGAARPDVWVTNYFYNETVEETVYRGIGEDYADFTAIIGNAQPVLAEVEKAIEEQAMAQPGDRRLAGRIDAIRGQIEQAQQAPITTGDLAADNPAEPPDLHPGITLDQLREALTRNPLTAGRLTATGAGGVYQVTGTAGGTWTVTFDRDIADDTEAELLTYGHPALEELLHPGGGAAEGPRGT